jgi:hypothetical protein
MQMIKYISAPDFHLDPKWIDVSIICAEAVRRNAQENDIDFIVLPGDFFNRPLIANDRGGINAARAIIKSWTAICPVAAIEGTLSHDGKGGYNLLEDCGLVLLHPNKLYGFGDFGYADNRIIELSPNSGYMNPECILFGINELNKSTILSQLSLSSEKANAEVEKLLEQYILEYIAPIRAEHANIPAIGLLHGNVSDAARENTDDVILRTSDILIRTEILEPSNLTRWELGHLHSPWQSEKIDAGYAGFSGEDDSPWGKTGFVPAMNLVEIESLDVYHKARITRMPYGLPMRKKIYAPLSSYDPNIAYWLHSKDRNATLTGGHPWSRVTYEPEKKETQRTIVDTNNLVALFKAIDPKCTPRILVKVESLQREHSAPHLSVDVDLKFVTIKGSSFWHGKTITFRIEKLPNGLTAIMGGNGEGKSSLLAFCSIYPVVIGKDTKSGRASAIKDFFTEPEASIEKIAMVNGIQHRHLINIKGAHTQTPKVECYLYVDSANQLETTSWDEMFSKCESLYGSFADYLLTTFYVQPLQGKQGSSLMSAGMTEIRNLVQSIAGVDREIERRYSLDRLAADEKTLIDTESWIKGAEEFIIDPEKLIKEKSGYDSELIEKEAAILLTIEIGKTAKAERDSLQIKKNASDAESKQKKQDNERSVKISNDIFVLQEDVSELKNLTKQLPAMRDNMQKIESREKTISDNEKLKNNYDAAINTYNRELGELQRDAKDYNTEKKSEYEIELNKYEREKARLQTRRADQVAIITRYNKPCFNCGKIPPDAEEQIDEANKEIKCIDDHISLLESPHAPEYKTVPEKLDRQLPTTPAYKQAVLYDGLQKTKLQADIEKTISAEATIKSKEDEIVKLEEEVKVLEAKIYNIDSEICGLLFDAEEKLRKVQDQYAEEKSKIAALRESINNITKQLKDAKEKQEEIEKKKATLPELEAEVIDWKYISGMLQPNKIPALELESVIQTIDAEATRILEPFLDGILSIETKTQQEGKKNTIDKFDIIVHNNETGMEQSFITFSPGVKAFISDAYVKALVQIRNNRAHRHYSPIISDEADGPIQPERVAAYYSMQDKFYAGTEDKVLVVSHAPDAHNFVQNHIVINDIIQ